MHAEKEKRKQKHKKDLPAAEGCAVQRAANVSESIHKLQNTNGADTKSPEAQRPKYSKKKTPR